MYVQLIMVEGFLPGFLLFPGIFSPLLDYFRSFHSRQGASKIGGDTFVILRIINHLFSCVCDGLAFARQAK